MMLCGEVAETGRGRGSEEKSRITGNTRNKSKKKCGYNSETLLNDYG